MGAGGITIWHFMIIVMMVMVLFGTVGFMRALINRSRKLPIKSTTGEIGMSEQSVATIDKMRWAVLFTCSVFLYAIFTNSSFQWSLGYVASSFAVGLVISAITWMFKRQWKWYDWMNVGSYIGVVLFLANVFLNPLLKIYIGRM
jgi:hypothetical protein